MSAAITSADGAVLVLEGNFNPSIVSPQWLLAHRLVTGKDAIEAEVMFTDPDLARFQIAGYAVEVRRDQVTIASTADTPVFETVGDFAVSIFGILTHTPVTAIAMNRVAHRALEPGGFAALSTRLAPIDPWKGILPRPHVRSLTMRGHAGKGEPAVEFTVEESDLVKPGAYVIAAKRMAAAENESRARGGEWALEQLNRHWHAWVAEAGPLIDQVVALR